MDDSISRQAAIDAICKACPIVEDYHKCDGYPKTSTWCDELVALRAFPSAQQWIPCSERLPEVNIDVLICNDDGIMHTAVMKAENIYETEFKTWHIKYCLYDYDVWDEGENGEIVAWMPLPEPWKGEEE